MSHTVTAIAAISKERRALGNKNELLWHIPGDLPRFKELTTGHPIIMGYKTFLSLPNPLPNRTNIVMVQEKDVAIDGVVIAHSPEEALEVAKEAEGNEKIYVIGGGMVYTAMLPYTDELDLTIVDDEPEADVFFPDYSEFTTVLKTEESIDTEPSFRRVLLSRQS